MTAHFTPETMRFLRGLVKHNERTWFEERRPVYETAVKAPLHALIEAVNADLATFAPEHVRPPHKVAMRIYRDTRFSPDKRPYKHHLSAWWARTGLEKTSAAGFFLQVGPAGVMLAGGIYAPEREDLLRVRQWLAEHHERFRATLVPLLKARAKSPALQPLDPVALTRNPKGFVPDHPAGDLLRARNWGVMLPLEPAAALAPGFDAVVSRAFRRMEPIVTLLNEPFCRSKPALEAPFSLRFTGRSS